MEPFGHAWRASWPLEPGLTYLNHGTVGVTPLTGPRGPARHPRRHRAESEPVSAARALRDRRRAAAAGPPAPPPGGRRGRRVRRRARRRPRLRRQHDDRRERDPAILSRSQAGDEILVSDFGYGGVTRAVTYAARERGAIVRTVAMPYPVRSADEIVEAFAAAITPNTKLAVVDHITSESGLVLPLAAIAARLPRARRGGARRRRPRARRHPARHPLARR